jgi:ribonuclease PH
MAPHLIKPISLSFCVSQSVEEKEYSHMLLKALEGSVALHTFPKTTVDVFAFVLQSGGGKQRYCFPSRVVNCCSFCLDKK